MLDSKSPKRGIFRSRSASPTADCPSPSPSSNSASAEDDTFMASTLSYLGSPTAQMLGLSAPLISPPPAYTFPRKPAYDVPWQPLSSPVTTPSTPVKASSTPIRPSSPTKAPRTPNTPRPIEPIIGDAESAISSVWDTPWPKPPATVPVSPIVLRQVSRSRTDSPTSSSEEAFGYPLYPSVTPPHMQSRPFQGPGVSSVSKVPASPTPSPRRPILKRPSTKGLQRSREKLGHGYSPSDVVYMTVVKETT